MNNKLIPGELLSEWYLHKKYCEVLDTENSVIISGNKYSPSTALLRLDHLAYESGYYDWLNKQINTNNILLHDGHYYLPRK